MPANLPPQYFEAEKRYRLAKNNQEKIEALEAMLSIMPKHKGTDKLRAELRKKIAKVSQESQRKPAIGRRPPIYYVKKQGAGQAILIGLPNSGKSQLVAAITEASPEVADYPFTTQTPIPGMAKFEDIQIQLVDIPPINDRGAQSWFPPILKSAELLLVIVDLGDDPLGQVGTIFEELDRMRIKPVGSSEEEPDQTLTQKRALIIGSKNDLRNSSENYRKLCVRYGGDFPLVSVSAKERAGLEELKRELYRALDIIRVYTKAPGKKPDLNEPVVLKRGSTVEDVALSVHKDLLSKLKYAQLWGSGKYSGQRVKREHVLEEGDIVELHV